MSLYHSYPISVSILWNQNL